MQLGQGEVFVLALSYGLGRRCVRALFLESSLGRSWLGGAKVHWVDVRGSSPGKGCFCLLSSLLSLRSLLSCLSPFCCCCFFPFMPISVCRRCSKASSNHTPDLHRVGNPFSPYPSKTMCKSLSNSWAVCKKPVLLWQPAARAGSGSCLLNNNLQIKYIGMSGLLWAQQNHQSPENGN